METNNTKEICSQIDQLLEKNVTNCILQALSLLLPSKFVNQKLKFEKDN